MKKTHLLVLTICLICFLTFSCDFKTLDNINSQSKDNSLLLKSKKLSNNKKRNNKLKKRPTPILSRPIPGGADVDIEEDPDGSIEAELEEEVFEEQVEQEDFEEQSVEDELQDLEKQ